MSPPAGVVVVDKPAGWTSHDVVARMRRLAGTRRVGHAGTLDPMATGVLIVGVGRATRLLGYLAAADKSYTATIRLGQATVTDDAEGDITAAADAGGLDDATIRSVLAEFVGDIEQVPSAVSAIKIDGRRAYQRVRAGEDVALAARPVHIAEITVSDVRREGTLVDVDVDVTCSTGTYIRALARDAGARLGVGGHLTVLRRTRVGGFGLSRSHTLDELNTAAGAGTFSGQALLSLDEVARATFPSYPLTSEEATSVRHGRALRDTKLGESGPVAMFDPDGRFLALYEQRGPDARAVAVFV